MKVYGALEQAGVEILNALPAVSDAFEGRQMILDDGNVYIFFQSEWRLRGSLTQAVKSIPSQDPLDDAGDILALDVDGHINTGFIRDTDKVPDQSGATAGQVLTTDGTTQTWEDSTGGLVVEYKNTDFTAEFGKHYLVDTAAQVVNIALPEISGLTSGQRELAKMRFSDYARNWHNNNAVVTPAVGDKVYTGGVDEPWNLDVALTWLQIQAGQTNEWNMDHVFQAVESQFGNNKTKFISGDPYVLTEDDLNVYIAIASGGAAVNIEVPMGLGKSGDTFTVIKGISDPVSFVPAVGVDINSTGSFTLGGQWATATIIQILPDTWVLTGEIE
jgi:hypothetical protein